MVGSHAVGKARDGRTCSIHASGNVVEGLCSTRTGSLQFEWCLKKLGIPGKRVLDTHVEVRINSACVEEPSHTILERHLVFEDARLRRSSCHNIVEDATLYGMLRIPIQAHDKAHTLHNGETNG